MVAFYIKYYIKRLTIKFVALTAFAHISRDPGLRGVSSIVQLISLDVPGSVSIECVPTCTVMRVSRYNIGDPRRYNHSMTLETDNNLLVVVITHV
jgi:hypothetical protein